VFCDEPSWINDQLRKPCRKPCLNPVKTLAETLIILAFNGDKTISVVIHTHLKNDGTAAHLAVFDVLLLIH
jgi:hypothetical protein